MAERETPAAPSEVDEEYRDPLSDSYLRLRHKLMPWGSMKTAFGGSDRFEKTEAALDALLADLEDALRAVAPDRAVSTLLEKLVSQAERDAAAELEECGRWRMNFTNALTQAGKDTAARSEAMHRAFAQIHQFYADAVRALLGASPTEK